MQIGKKKKSSQLDGLLHVSASLYSEENAFGQTRCVTMVKKELVLHRNAALLLTLCAQASKQDKT